MLPGWQTNFLTYLGREMLVKLVLSAMPTFFLTVFNMPKWGFARIDKFRMSFLWKGQDHENIKGGHCLVSWQTCMKSRNLGGFGINDLEKCSSALRLR
jgi:hypothetical protein